MGIELVIRLRQSPLCSQLDETCPFRPRRAQGVSSACRLLFCSDFMELKSRVALNSPGHALKSCFSRARSRSLIVFAHGSSSSDSFGSDWTEKVPSDRNLFDGERDQTTDRIAADGNNENGFWSSGAGLSWTRRGALNSTKRLSRASGLSENNLGPCQVGSVEEESFVRRDLSTSADGLMGFCPVEKARVGSSGSASGELPLLGGAATGGVGIPLSLKMLKRRHGRGKLATGLAEVGNSLQEAFSSMVFMMKTLHSHTLDIRRQLFFEEVEDLLNMVQREMSSSFLWLFQQIFSCTPELMILVMILLVNFTVFSVGNNPAFSPQISSLAMVSFLTKISNISEYLETAVPISKSSDSLRANLEKAFLSSPPLNAGADLHTDSGRAGDGGGRSYAVAGCEDGDFHLGGGIETSAMYSHEDIIPPEVSNMAASLAYEDFGSYQSEHSSSGGGLSVSSNTGSEDNAPAQGGLQKPGQSDSVVLDEETLHNIVAPVKACLEGDDYSCYDRTDLAYQQAIGDDKTNPLLLANYAQFLFLVRHNHDRAEELFRRAVIADPCNSHAIGCFASFLWLARHNLAAAEKAYRAALSADPSSPFHAANYAHFLWHSGQ